MWSTTPRTSAVFWPISDGVVRNQNDALWSETNPPSSTGSVIAGSRLKKSPPTEGTLGFSRRERVHAHAHGAENMGSSSSNSDPLPSLQSREDLGDLRSHCQPPARTPRTLLPSALH